MKVQNRTLKTDFYTILDTPFNEVFNRDKQQKLHEVSLIEGRSIFPFKPA